MDRLNKKRRSWNMSRIKGTNTQPEVVFRKYSSDLGIKGYRIKNNKRGRPDMYFPKARVAVFIDGCFWHGCPKCYVPPKSNKKYWREKITTNRLRDLTVNSVLRKEGIRVIRIWEHEIRKRGIAKALYLQKTLRSRSK